MKKDGIRRGWVRGGKGMKVGVEECMGMGENKIDDENNETDTHRQRHLTHLHGFPDGFVGRAGRHVASEWGGVGEDGGVNGVGVRGRA